MRRGGSRNLSCGGGGGGGQVGSGVTIKVMGESRISGKWGGGGGGGGDGFGDLDIDIVGVLF